MKLNLVSEADLTRPEMDSIKLRLHRVEAKEISTVTLGAIANSLLTTRGDIIVRNATVPDRLALTVPASPIINVLGVANGETQPTWKSASSAGAADAHLVATDAAGVTALVGLVSGYIAPAADGTTAVQIRKADKASVIVNVNTSTGFVGVNTAAPLGALAVENSVAYAGLVLQKSGFAHGVTNKANTDIIGFFVPYSATSGGTALLGISKATGISGFYFDAVNTNASGNTQPLMVYDAGVKSGASAVAVPATEKAFEWRSGGSAVATMLGNGYLGLNKTAPGSRLAVVGLTDYANNAAAITGGLSAGDFYTETGTNPKRVCVVY